MGELIFRIREFFRFNPKELRDMAISILIVTFAFAYDDPFEAFSMTLWFANFLKFLIIVSISLFFHVSVQKVIALSQGNNAEYQMWTLGLLFTLAVTLITQGRFWVILPGGVLLHHLTIQRMGRFRYGLNVMSQGIVGMFGPLANLVLATASLAMSRQIGFMPAFFDSFAMVNFLMLIYSLLPFPHLDGLHLFFASRLGYVFIASTLLAYYLLTLANIYSWIFAFIIGGICWLLFYIFFERKVS